MTNVDAFASLRTYKRSILLYSSLRVYSHALRSRVRSISTQFQASDSPCCENVLAELLEIENAVSDMEYSFE